MYEQCLRLPSARHAVQKADPNVWLPFNVSMIGQKAARQNAQQCRLSGSVRTDKTGMFPFQRGTRRLERSCGLQIYGSNSLHEQYRRLSFRLTFENKPSKENSVKHRYPVRQNHGKTNYTLPCYIFKIQQERMSKSYQTVPEMACLKKGNFSRL